MQLSKGFEQSCCVLGIIARHGNTAVTSGELNQRMGVSLSYLSKITRKLVVAGLIRSAQGVNGGYVLAQPMHAVTLRMVVEAIEGEGSFFRPSGVIERVFVSQKKAAQKGISLIESSLADAEAHWRRHLERVTMQDVIDNALSSEEE